MQIQLNKTYNMDWLKLLSLLADESVDCCITSTPYFGLRDYKCAGQIGLEKKPELFIERLVFGFREIRRVLKKTGTCWLNIGDSYVQTKSRYNSAPQTMSGKVRDVPMDNNRIDLKGHEFLKNKDLALVPFRLAIALQEDGWWVRQDIIWHKPNPMPESVEDRCTKAHEYIFLLTKSETYFYDHDAIKEPYTSPLNRWGGVNLTKNGISAWDEETGQNTNRNRSMRPDPKGRNKRSVWHVETTPYAGAHFATFPEKLILPMVLAGCPEGGTILDPFMGAGTTALVALKNNRNFIGSELNPISCKLADERIAGIINQEKLSFV